MECLVFNDLDPVSKNSFTYFLSIKKEHSFQDYGIKHHNIKEAYKNDSLVALKINSELTTANYLDEFGFECIYFISKHLSSSGVFTFTTHSLGNPSKEKIEINPFELSKAAPQSMYSFIKEFYNNNKKLPITYEATHHGPLLKTPSLFLEFGGSTESLESTANAKILIDTVLKSIKMKHVPSKISLGMGSGHYPSKFTSLAIKKDYAFSYILPYYVLNELNLEELTKLFDTAYFASKDKFTNIIIEKKRLNKQIIDNVLYLIEQKGLHYELL